MKRCTVSETQLNDHLDKRSSPDESLQVECHLEECASCREFYEGLVALRVLAADLPRSLEPERDLWPQIVCGLSKRNQSGAEGVRLQRIIRLIIAAAACLIVSLGAFEIFRNHLRTESGPEYAFQSGPSLDDNMRAEIAKAENAYLEAANDFLAELDADETLMTPDTRKVLEGNLAITNKAIEEVKVALERRPSDFRLARKLLATHELRVELLQQATQLSFAVRNGG